MTKRSLQPQRASGAAMAPAGIYSAAISPFRSIFLLLLVLALALGALAGCTRDRPLVEDAATLVAEAAVPMADTAEGSVTTIDGSGSPASPSGETRGEPEVVVSETTTDTTAAEGGAGEVTIVEYEVVSGDTLLSIALKHNSTTDEIRTLNNLRTDLIQPGQVLSVPVQPAEPTPTPEPFTHVVQAGESLTGIAAQYDVSWADLVQANRLPDANALRAGMELIIPGHSPTAGGEADSEGAPAVVDPTQQATHTIKAGQTLTQIAQMYDIPLGELQRANNIANPSLVKPGQVLTLPGMTVAQAIAALSTTHTVTAGESLSQIAKDYGVEMSAIMRANNMSNANLLRPGQQLIIPPPSN